MNMNNDRFAYIAKVLEALDNYFNEGGVYVAALSDGAQLLDDDTTIAEAVSKAYGLLSSPNSPIKNTPQSSGPQCSKCGAFTTRKRATTHGLCMKCEILETQK